MRVVSSRQIKDHPYTRRVFERKERMKKRGKRKKQESSKRKREKTIDDDLLKSRVRSWNKVDRTKANRWDTSVLQLEHKVRAMLPLKSDVSVRCV